MTTFIYELRDPFTGETRYLGKSDNPFNRFKQHLSCKKRLPVTDWIQKLLKQGVAPHMELLDEVPVSEWQFWEREYLRIFRATGVRLLNLAEGGEGVQAGYKHSVETKLKVSRSHRGNVNARGLLGRKQSTEHVAKRSRALRGNTNGAGHTHSRPWSAFRRAKFESKKAETR